MRPLRLVTSTPEEGQPIDSNLPVVPPGSGPPQKVGGTSSLPQAAAIEHVFRFAGPGQGWRMTSIGGTGSGKTYFQKEVAKRSALRDGMVLIHDAKDKVPQYTGAIRDSVFSLARNPIQGNQVVFRHENPETVAEFAWKASARGVTSLVIIDEMSDALSAPRHFKARGDSRISEIYRKGRSRGVSMIGSTQLPQWLPTEAMDLSDFKVMFKMDSRSLNYSQWALRLTNDVTETIRTLKRGQFVLIEQGVDWNGVIYGPH